MIYHFNNLRVDRFGEHATPASDVFDQLVERGALDLFALQVSHWIHEVERHTALSKFADKQLLLFTAWYICKNIGILLKIVIVSLTTSILRSCFITLRDKLLYSII